MCSANLLLLTVGQLCTIFRCRAAVVVAEHYAGHDKLAHVALLEKAKKLLLG